VATKKILGFPVIESDYIPKGEIIFTDFSQSVVIRNFRQKTFMEENMDKVLDWAKAQLNSKKFWVFVGALATAAAGYFTGEIDAQYALQNVVVAALVWLGLYGGDVARAKFLK